MKRLFGLFASVLAAQLTFAAFTPAQTKDIQQIVHETILAHPEILVQASKKLQEQAQQQETGKAMSAIKSHVDALFFNVQSPQLGNPQGNLVIAEFFDYQCGHCQRLSPVLKAAINAHPNLRVIYKDLPIYGQTSMNAAAAGLAAYQHQQFSAVHEALFNTSGKLTKPVVTSVLSSFAIDEKTFTTTLNSDATKQLMNQNYRLADAIGIVGTPALIIAKLNGKTLAPNGVLFVPGAVDKDTLEKLIQQVSAA